MIDTNSSSLASLPVQSEIKMAELLKEDVQKHAERPNELQNSPPIKEISVEQLYKDALVSVTDVIERPPVSLMIDDSIICTLGNFITVSGKAKSKKTTFVSMLMAASISGNLNNRLSAPLPANKKRIIFIDTEQGKWHVQGVIKRVYNLIGKSHSMDLANFNTFSLRKYDTTQRLNVIEYILNKYNDIGIIYLDGVRDIVFSINDEKEAVDTATRLLRWTEEREISIVCVLHQNKGDTNVRGHLGTELVNKSETVISIEKDKQDEQRSIVQADHARNIDFVPFAFRYNESGLPEIDDSWSTRQKDRKATNKPVDCPIDIQIKILSELKKTVGERPNYSEILTQISLAIAKHYLPVGRNIALEYIKHFENNGNIIGHGKERTRGRYYTIEM